MVVVRPVGDYRRRPPAQRFQAARPFYRLQPGGYGGRRRRGVAAGGRQRFYGGHGHGGVAGLEIAQQRQDGAVGMLRRADGQILPRIRHGRRLPAYRFVNPRQRGGLRRRRRPYRGQRLGKLGRRHHRNAGLDDARFVGGDFANGVAQDGGVIQAYRRNDADGRRDHIGGVQPPAQANLNDAGVHFVRRETMERHGRQVFKERGRAGVRVGRISQVMRPHGVHQPGEPFRGHRRAVPPDAFTERMQMGRGIKAGGSAGGAQDGFHHRRHAALALGAGDVDDAPLPPVRVAHPRQQPRDAGQIVDAFLARDGRHSPLVVHERQQAGNGGGVGHHLRAGKSGSGRE